MRSKADKLITLIIATVYLKTVAQGPVQEKYFLKIPYINEEQTYNNYVIPGQ